MEESKTDNQPDSPINPLNEICFEDIENLINNGGFPSPINNNSEPSNQAHSYTEYGTDDQNRDGSLD